MNKIAIAAMGLTAAFAFSLAACAEMHYASPSQSLPQAKAAAGIRCM